ncbi:sulfotransferase family protein [Methylorubrum thiocyanatum]|uniref:sulfotransferase family protein n=1 Tax=Methylorubrum thiocyanatum TaxID=47958 RepID=UPI003648A786
MKPTKWEDILSNIRSESPSHEVTVFKYISNISLKYSYMYVETPKAGCSTIKSTLINAELDEYLDFENFEDLHVRQWSPLLDPSRVGPLEKFLDKCRVKFCFVRNPYSRILSCYLNKIAPLEGWRRKQIIDYYEMHPDAGITFKQFVDFVCHQDYPDMDIHWRLQYDLLCARNIDYDFIGKFENLDVDLNNVLSQIGIDAAKYYRKEDRHSTKAESLLDEFYDSEYKDKIYAKFFFDFEAYDYSR